jgi:hypothetical protein
MKAQRYILTIQPEDKKPLGNWFYEIKEKMEDLGFWDEVPDLKFETMGDRVVIYAIVEVDS